MTNLTTLTLKALIRSNAVRGMAIVQRRGAFEVWVHCGPSLTESGSESLHTSRGELRQWANLGAAYGFIRAQGYKGTVEVDDAAEPCDEQTGPGGLHVEVTASDHGGDQYDFSVRTPGGRVVHGGGGFCDPDTARVVGQTYLRAFC